MCASFYLTPHRFKFPETYLSSLLSSFTPPSLQAKDAKAKTGAAFENAKDAVKDGVEASKDYVNAKSDQAGKDGEAIKQRAINAKDEFNKSAK